MSRIVALLLASAALIAGVAIPGVAAAHSASQAQRVVAGDGFGWGTPQSGAALRQL
ncbi:hypothetical protein [Streptomyces sp. NBC_01264]|uniref:hypothetical protein n=1 Tax=Streptomyces sp. NBC_01264 TaxID=2903804 RepID=UPI002254A64F|nr:hypothetical protein [Streptomyces sp. NBC_01264]MCX4783667.1 hypothetical protein [Streptomyces sp. NBC_01264]